ncbi:hypothetical protein LDL77_06440 [Flagellimonas marinaquae]|uniref:hypothetical protein n=1 Tax=Flagellimonas aurea TaxID=2915619 RepID=UPI001CE13A09|nr:hypothetical protein LDL77_06440 [Allomuricauda aquimarina]
MEDNHKVLLAYLTKQDQALNIIYRNMTAELAPVLRKYKATSSSRLWHGNTALKKQVDRILDKYQKILLDHLTKTTKTAWDLSDDHNDQLVDDYIKGINVPEGLKKQMMARNIDAFKAFVKRKSGGFTMSQRVWKITEATRAQLDYFVAEGLTSGRSSTKLSMDIRRYLQQPEKRFRRIRNPETGKLMLSNPAKDYHPGTGVYRSSYKNALRLARNEINIAYRTADIERRKNLPFVLGIEINLSPAHKEYDICDELVGTYPSDIKFTGFHPNCLCYTTAKLMPKKDFVSYLKGKRNGLAKPVSSIPKSAIKYLNEKKDKLKDLKSAPYFIKDNFKLTDKGYVPIV